MVAAETFPDILSAHSIVANSGFQDGANEPILPPAEASPHPDSLLRGKSLESADITGTSEISEAQPAPFPAKPRESGDL